MIPDQGGGDFLVALFQRSVFLQFGPRDSVLKLAQNKVYVNFFFHENQYKYLRRSLL